jgi:hypothetical protein
MWFFAQLLIQEIPKSLFSLTGEERAVRADILLPIELLQSVEQLGVRLLFVRFYISMTHRNNSKR